MVPLSVDGHPVVGITVELPRTRLVIATVPAGYLMCGALDIDLLDRLLGHRHVVAGRSLGVRSLEDLLEKPLESVTAAAGALGLRAGMSGADALRLLLAAGDPTGSLREG